VIGFDIRGVLLSDVPGSRDEFVDYPRVDGGTVGGDLDRGRPVCQRAGEECPCCGAVAAFGD
jgi:hypothetical protein